MADRPLLLFPTPEKSSKSKLGGGGGSFHRPSHATQVGRVAPHLQQLQTVLNNKGISLQDTPAGIEPELVLVVETVGSVDGFLSAVKKIDGLEWLAEYEQSDIVPDQYFYDPKDKAKHLSGRLFFLFANQAAMQQLLSLWNTFANNPNRKLSEIFDYGLASVGRLFQQVKTIRHWNVQDRIEETGVLDAWREDLEHDGDRAIRVEVEMWYRGTYGKRQEAREQIDQLIRQLGGTVLDDCIISDIAYHALLAEIPANAAQQITEHPEVDLIKCDSVMFFRPVGQMATGKRPVEGEFFDHEPEDAALPTGEPIVAILDGLPLANHSLLKDRLIIDDPDDYASEYTIPDRTHGTAITSLVVHGDLSDEAPPLSRPVYMRPIMKPIPWFGSPRPEQIPDDALVVDQIHRAVLHIFEGEGTSSASAPTVRIVNFSIGDPYRQFTQILSPLARLLDWLSVKYSVLFVVSAGNHLQDITTNISKTDFDVLSNSEKEAIVVKVLYGDTRHRRILSPGESINSITVGALHYDTADASHIPNAVNLFESLLPSPVSAFGSGYRRAIKPELLFNGGRVLYNEPLGTTTDASFKFRKQRSAPGNKVASPSALAGDLNKVVYSCGTSNSAALISRMATACHDTLIDVFEEQAPDIELNSYIAPLLKAMIVHGCSWGEIGTRLQAILQTPDNGRHIRHWISRWLGYGVPDGERVLACTEQRATLLGFGQLGDEEAHLFSLPLPPSLSARRDRRQLTVTLAWMSPIAATTQRYRVASLWFEVEGDTLAPNRQDADWNAVRRGTIQHEIFEGDRAVAITDDASLSIKVNCRKDATRIQEPVAYGLAVSLEVAEGIDIAIYNEIRTRIVSPIEIRPIEGR